MAGGSFQSIMAAAGRVKPVAGNQTWGPGNYNIIIPYYDVLTLYIYGAGGGSGGVNVTGTGMNVHWGGTGGVSYFNGPDGQMVAGGGGGGGNTTSGKDGLPAGAAGGAGGASGGNNSNAGGQGNAGGSPPGAPYNQGGPGGRGGLVVSQWFWNSGNPPIFGGSYALGIGVGGAGGWYDGKSGSAGGNPGANAHATLYWS